jgi:hypothetical protein
MTFLADVAASLCSLRYHLLHPEYLYFRIRELQKNYRLRVVLCHVDVVSRPVTLCLLAKAFVGVCAETSASKELRLVATFCGRSAVSVC